MSERTVLVPGARRVEATLEESTDGAEACVVACPPHPQDGGHRGDRRLRAVADALTDGGIAVLRFDYGPWDEGRGEREDTRNALRWAAERYDRVGIVGFSFGGAMAARAAASTAVDLCGVALLAPATRGTDDSDAAETLQAIDAPVAVIYGTRDPTVEWQPFYRAGKATDAVIEPIDADHSFVGQLGTVAPTVGGFLLEHCDGSA
ncbi:alpha/beta hydrolase [Halanaeroarchaeum sulfurireducens]|uniref:Putative hydrolase of the alpha/beta superfamily n=1 Tax=Halanaeroarchaeum sulfurireducens TaxID=1604004 RepID=A0A0F7PGE5_9EURY|nr:alpha/beta family hydrolase [Halanaeroarchaeum sulfurireducens]AKH98373.1 putative hydrolase of the alpha/beta superfamily [Halanaeroarchaeum sulfurireducens]ALG82767.1 putative hydrolase of the alpha/beta superfamily [Halanaeroarchaeum sulfurireducens]